MLKVKITEVRVKNIVVKSNLPKASYVVNPYTGCQYGCVYCYADFMRRWTGHIDETWGQFVDVKVNAPDLIKENVGDYGDKDILFSSVTDPYQPIEAQYKLTRRLLEKLSKQNPQPTVGILTKSTLVTRDIDILKRFGNCNVGFSFSTLNDEVRRVLEPVTPPTARKINALKVIHDADIETYVFISPIMPFLTDIGSIVVELKPYANLFMFENLNVRPSLWHRIRAALEKIDSNLVPKYEDIYFTRWGKKEFWKPVEQEILDLCARQHLEPQIFFHH